MYYRLPVLVAALCSLTASALPQEAPQANALPQQTPAPNPLPQQSPQDRGDYCTFPDCCVWICSG
jgi:hypothetical protein